MPRQISQAILDSKLQGGPKCNLLRIDLPSPFFLTDNAFDVDFNGDTYEADGLLLHVDPGVMSVGAEANAWNVVLSSVDAGTYSNLLGQDYINRWVYHYVMYFNDTPSGLVVAGVEARKFGLILMPEDEDDEKTAKIKLIVASPFGDPDLRTDVKTNQASQHRHFGADDNVMQFCHEVGYTVPPANNGGFGGDRPIPGEELP